ncbi:arginine N-methyltransferase 1 [Seminavis robusta]|uniref:Arginine N-methyltransferase 1 n=1 Tax=Seminavis robusta TaxID=568900 RepID=A0A9N8HHG5_9STRA|nr:arginine N-methyltransferase 1 [Seminavis robusta]|eukprot:Sro536_g162080.1 arginine N-methyltransferase 1 (427) ;mRNA; r:8142-9422
MNGEEAISSNDGGQKRPREIVDDPSSKALKCETDTEENGVEAAKKVLDGSEEQLQEVSVDGDTASGSHKEEESQQPKEESTTSSSTPAAKTDDVKEATDNRTSKDYYFDSYAHHSIHEEMLKDEVRTKTYQMAILQNPQIFKDKIVLDVGCGTGVLSMFAAQAGAKHVYAVDCSSIIHQARTIVKLNNFEDKITLIEGKIEEIKLPVAQIDVLLSEWIGYCLLYESMLDSVLFARDKWLVPNGIVFPDKSVLYIAAIEDGQVKKERIDFWDNVYGFDMTPLKDIAIKEPVVDVVDAKALVTDAVPVLTLDILTCTKEDLAFKNPFKLKAHRNDYIHGLVTYFECAFTQLHKPIGFSTAPFARYTHWKQTIFYLRNTLTICNRETIEGEFACRPNAKNNRDLDISISLSFKGLYSQFEQKDIEYRLR